MIKMQKTLKTSETQTTVKKQKNGAILLCMYGIYDPEMIMEAYFTEREFDALTKIFNEINKEETK